MMDTVAPVELTRFRGHPRSGVRPEEDDPMANYKYPAEYRVHAVELWRTSGKSQRAVSLELGISNEFLRRWVRQDDLDKELRSDGPTTTEREELRLLRADEVREDE
jgi:transposase